MTAGGGNVQANGRVTPGTAEIQLLKYIWPYPETSFQFESCALSSVSRQTLIAVSVMK